VLNLKTQFMQQPSLLLITYDTPQVCVHWIFPFKWHEC